jgi:glycosidase
MQATSYHGYDVIDYRAIERDYGTNEQFQRLVEEAHARGIAVIVDMVINHTSRDHPWFQDARTPGSGHDDWYIWRTDDPGYEGPWGQDVWHRSGNRYYYAIFWDGMPDLNLQNPDVTAEIQDIGRFWLRDMDVDGFRLDAAKHLIEDRQIQENTEETHAWLRAYRAYLHGVDPDVLIVGEIWSPTYQVANYVGDQLDLAFEFDLAEAMIASADYGNRNSVERAMRSVLDQYPEGQYAPFLTNHDQNRVMSQLGGDLGKAKVAASMLLTAPGVPFIYYGEELGMVGEKPDERIRTPMQWDSTEDTAGFTSAERPWQPLAFGYEERNVVDESAYPDSLLNHYRALIHLRNDYPPLAVGDYAVVDCDQQEVYSFLRYTGDEAIVVIINLSTEAIDDYRLSLDSGSLGESREVEVLFGSGDVSAPEVNAAGGFDSYTPVSILPPQSTLIVRFAP